MNAELQAQVCAKALKVLESIVAGRFTTEHLELNNADGPNILFSVTTRVIDEPPVAEQQELPLEEPPNVPTEDSQQS